MYINGYYREPTFLYESMYNVIGFILLLVIRRKVKVKTGMITGLYFIWYGLGRVVIETFRSDSLMIGNIKVAQVVSILGIMIGIVLIIHSYKKNNLYIDERVEI